MKIKRFNWFMVCYVFFLGMLATAGVTGDLFAAGSYFFGLLGAVALVYYLFLLIALIHIGWPSKKKQEEKP